MGWICWVWLTWSRFSPCLSTWLIAVTFLYPREAPKTLSWEWNLICVFKDKECAAESNHTFIYLFFCNCDKIRKLTWCNPWWLKTTHINQRNGESPDTSVPNSLEHRERQRTRVGGGQEERVKGRECQSDAETQWGQTRVCSHCRLTSTCISRKDTLRNEWILPVGKLWFFSFRAYKFWGDKTLHFTFLPNLAILSVIQLFSIS